MCFRHRLTDITYRINKAIIHRKHPDNTQNHVSYQENEDFLGTLLQLRAGILARPSRIILLGSWNFKNFKKNFSIKTTPQND